ncbi:hypothetical protein Cgig2_009857 [Carnegiea gigantea]|uniref:Uncharacterized protein n=1 Tax=Carnegiea gigantea TaxID=171969 RepID=A0A9Q1KM47_9CARY|nr:hypothetical protein Cgig2_009857 [Carnegiea gigantea]
MASSKSTSNMSSSKSNVTPKSQQKASTRFTDLFAFDGPAPERTNSQLAMIWFVPALARVLAKGADLFAHISDQWFPGTSIVFSVAPLVPLSKGETVESKNERLMISNAELLHGRLRARHVGVHGLSFHGTCQTCGALVKAQDCTLTGGVPNFQGA